VRREYGDDSVCLSDTPGNLFVEIDGGGGVKREVEFGQE